MPVQIRKNPSCGFWHPPACLNYKSEKGCVMATNAISDKLRQKESPTRSRRKVINTSELRITGSSSNEGLFCGKKDS